MSAFDVMTRGGVLDAALQARDYLVTCGVPAALAAKDPRLWGRRAVDHSRLGWLDLPFASRALLEQIRELVAEVRQLGLDQVVLIGVGAEGLAAQAVMEADPGGPAVGGTRGLTVLDGSDPAAMEPALARLERTLVVLSSKVGVSIEGDAYRRIFAAAFREHGLSEREIAGRFLVITDHGSPLHDFARRCGYRIGLTDPYLPGHFGALSAYGLVPAVLAGAQVSGLLDEAASVVPSLGKDDDNPGLLLGAVLGGCAQQDPASPTRDKLVLRGGTAALTGWVSQLVATGTGKRGRGIVPLQAPGQPAPELSPDAHSVTLGTSVDDADTSVWGPLGAQFLLWEYATAVAGWLLGVNPFEGATALAQEAEDDAAALLRRAAGGPLPAGDPDFVDGGIEVRGGPGPAGPPTGAGVRGAVDALLRAVPASGYLSLITYLPDDLPGRSLAPPLARRAGRPVTYGPGPGHLHGTGPVHLDGPGNGAFLVVTGTAAGGDRPVPGRPYTLGRLRLARALADVRALRRRGLPVLWLHLREPGWDAGRLAEAVRGREP
ncbi:glucose-6-phosphate isomerase [Thermomonospora echinospora]|uniref:Glucose-6-phosphate isomerase n=1 Tax=Thermomonospora echinospora TaxID=1992 RepID=A0A1H6BWM7_9ACTN|nr:phosphoheptose isomerase [Thermomonospora echinospora]SEG65101.1 glucose-6-phosphate isomerase [Thermomonospora echinospora]